MATVYREGIAVTDGAVHVSFGAGGSLPSGTTIPSPTITGTVTAEQVTGIERILAQWTVPVILASSGSMGNNGAVSGMTALRKTYSNGAWLYLPAAAIEAGSAAGFYWFVASSTTAGTVYNSTFNGASVPTAGTATPFATTGPGAFTGIATGEIVAATVTVPANAIGPSGWLLIRGTQNNNNAVGDKIFRVRLGGGAGTIHATNTVANAFAGFSQTTIFNQGAGQQVATSLNANNATVTATGGATYSSVDTTASTTLVFSLEKATATNNANWEGAVVSIVYGT
jgi:hypothetical protein